MGSFVRALYDFSGEPNTSEISITSGEVLQVTRTDVGEGWWEGKNTRGQVGLFPAAYVEAMSAAEVAAQSQHANGVKVAPPMPPPPAAQSARYDQTADDYNEDNEWEDDWDDDNETYSEIGPPPPQNSYAKQSGSAQNQQVNYANMNLPPTPSDDVVSLSSVTASTHSGTVKKSGMFGKSSDSYILGTVNVVVPDSDKAYIIQVENFYHWQPNPHIYSVKVASPKKGTKFKGMKSFIAYQLTPSFNNISVSRRYKHFDWLHERLVDKFGLIPIPPLPDKQISGRYEEQFIEHRQVQLQEFVDWVCRHPILSKCDVWLHFLTCTDEKRWKTGKRTAEKDTLVGVTYCSAIYPPERQLLQSFVDSQMESFSNFVHAMDGAVKNLLAISSEQTKRMQTQAKKDFQRVGDGLSELARSLEIDERRSPSSDTSLARSVGLTGGLYISMGQLFGEQPKQDWIPFSDRLHIYRGILGSFPDILNTHKGAMNKRKECERLVSEQKMGNAQIAEVNRRTDIISYTCMAEMSHFRAERDKHLKETMRNFIDAQIQFYQNIVVRLQEAQKQFV